jgi:hypothetical protein
MCLKFGADGTLLVSQEPTGGRVFVFNMNLPIAEGKGQLRNRDDQKALGTDRVCGDARAIVDDIVTVYCSCNAFGVSLSFHDTPSPPQFKFVSILICRSQRC